MEDITNFKGVGITRFLGLYFNHNYNLHKSNFKESRQKCNSKWLTVQATSQKLIIKNLLNNLTKAALKNSNNQLAQMKKNL